MSTTQSSPGVSAQVLRLLGDLDWRTRGAFRRYAEESELSVDYAAAEDALAALFPKDVIAKIVEDNDRISLAAVLPLFLEGWSNAHRTLLYLAADLACCPGWTDHRQLVKRLRHPEEHDSARFEVGLWAGARREDLVADYQDPGSSSGCDLVVLDGVDRVHIEAKAIDVASGSRRRGVLQDALSSCVSRCMDRFDDLKHCLIVIPHQALVRATLEGRPEFDDLAAAFSAALGSWCDTCLRPLAEGVSATVPDVGEVRLLTSEKWRGGFAYDIVGVPVPTFEKEVARSLRYTAKAVRQLASAADVIRVMAVWTGTTTCPADAAGRAAKLLVRENPARFSGIDWIVFINSHTRFGDWKTSAVPVATRPGLVPAVDRRWLRAMTRWQRCS